MRCFSVGRGAQIVVLPTRDSATKRAKQQSTSSDAGAVVALQLWIAGGTAAERPDEHGCAHLLEHMLFKPGADGRDLAAEIEGLGGDVNAFTSHDETVVYATVPAGVEDQALAALLEATLRPELDPDALATEATVVVEEILQYRDDPGAVGMQAVYAGLFGRHPYARPVLGTRADVLGHDAKRLRRFHRRVYAARRTSLVVVGPVDPKAMARVAEPWLAALPRGAAVDEGKAVGAPHSRPRVRVLEAELAEAHVHVAWRGPSLPARDAVALEVASIVLGYGDASRLTLGVRRKQKLVSDVHASFYPARNGSGLTISAHVEPKRVREAVAAILTEVDGLARAPLSAEEITRARVVLASDLVYRRETAQGHAHALGQNLSTAGTLEFDHRYHETLDRLTAGDVRRACERWLSSRGVVCGVVVPRGGDAKRLRKALAADVAGRPRAVAKTRLRSDRHGVVATQLPSGVRVLAKVDRRVPLSSGWILWPGGLRREDARRQGASSMMATLLTRGCAAIDGDALAREVEGQAAALDGFSGRSTAGLHFECMAQSTAQILRRAVQSALAPTFAAKELDEARRVVLQDLATERDDLAKLAFRGALTSLYRGHPFRWRRQGTQKSVGAFSSANLRRNWARWYPMEQAVVAVCGDIDLDGLLGVLHGELGELPPRADAPSPPQWSGAEPRYPRRPVELVETRDREQAHLVLAVPGLSFFDPATAAVDVLLAVLGGQAGRLFMALREAEGLVYHVAANSTEGVDAGDLTFYAAASPDRMARAREVLEAELARICTDLVGADELSRAKALLVGQHAMGMERHGRVAFQLAFNQAFGIELHHHHRYRQRIAKVGPRVLRDLAQRLLDPSRRVVALVGP